ncbi:MAG: type II toxin-antitoxin system RelE/ParE family toxin [Microvirga sp.]|nr:type II toxin-antitoxin system RelE/ParE family toxin [Microvirga sp.]
MMAAFDLSPRARWDLSEIWDYTCELWGEEQAERYLRLINKTGIDLASGRLRGRPVDSVRDGYPRLSVGAHVLFYRSAGADGIEVIRILHQRMDFESRL